MNTRTIKFRVWDNENKIWVKNPFVAAHPLFSLNSKFELDYVKDNFDGIPAPIYNFQQFTGAFDKNGVEIYEGDIIAYANNKYPVVFSPYCCSFLLDVNGRAAFDAKHGHCYMFSKECEGSYEVVGNIFENHE